MNTPTHQAESQFDRLLGAMPVIAEAVNKFSSEENQRRALHVLVQAFGLPVQQAPDSPPNLTVVQAIPEAKADVAPVASPAPEARSAETGERKRARKPAAKKSWDRVRDLNFRPDGKMSLRDFVEEKKPAKQAEWNVVLVYYLNDILAVPAIGVGHVLAAYTELGQKPPSNPDNSLQVTASTKNWLDTSDMKAIKLTYSGRTAVEHDMPRSAKSPA